MTIYTKNGIFKDGRLISPVELIREVSQQYTRSGKVHHMEARICDTPFSFTLTSKERHNPRAWLERELGPAAAGFDEKDSPVLLAAIDAMSNPGHQPTVVDAGGFHQKASGVHQNGFQITDFVVESAKRVDMEQPTSVHMTLPTDTPSRYIEITTRRGDGPAKVSRISHADCVSNMASSKSVGG